MTLTEREIRRIVVTGAAGIIGHSAIPILANDFDVTAIVRNKRGPENARTIKVDLSNVDEATKAFQGADAVVHLAAAAQLDAPWEDVLRDNIAGTYSVMEASRRAGVDRVVLASSHHVVGMFEEEGAPGIYAVDRTDHIGTAEQRPDSLYAVSKVFGEALGRFYHERYGLAVICLRIGVVREDDDPSSAAVAASASWLGLSAEDRYARTRAVWLSKRDAAELIRCALKARVRWAIVYGTSNNPRVLWDPTPARDLLGFMPRDRPQIVY